MRDESAEAASATGSRLSRPPPAPPRPALGPSPPRRQPDGSSKPGDVLAVDVDGIVHPGRAGLEDLFQWTMQGVDIPPSCV